LSISLSELKKKRAGQEAQKAQGQRAVPSILNENQLSYGGSASSVPAITEAPASSIKAYPASWQSGLKLSEQMQKTYDPYQRMQEQDDRTEGTSWGEVLGKGLYGGVVQANLGIANTMDALGVSKIPGIKQFNEASKKASEQYLEEYASLPKTKAQQVGADIAQSGGQALVDVPFMLASAPVSASVKGVQLATKAPSVAKAVLEFASKPVAIERTAVYFGNDYAEAKKEGATESQAISRALMSAVPTALIEGAGGLDALTSKIIKKQAAAGGKAIIQDVLKSAFEEGVEEVAQYPFQAASKLTYKKDIPLYSNSQEAVINPKEMAYQGALGAFAGGVFGGGISGINTLVSPKTKTDIPEVQAPETVQEKQKAIPDFYAPEKGAAMKQAISGYLPEASELTTTATQKQNAVMNDFNEWRKKNFGGSFGKMNEPDMQALRELYREDTGIDFERALGFVSQPETQKQIRTIPEIKTTPIATRRSILDLQTSPVDATKATARELPSFVPERSTAASIAIDPAQEQAIAKAVEKDPGVQDSVSKMNVILKKKGLTPKYIYDEADIAFNGSIKKDVVTINLASTEPILNTAVHELVHHWANTDPTTYTKYSEQVGELIKNDPKYQQLYKDTYTAYRIRLGIVTDSQIKREVEAAITKDFVFDEKKLQDLVLKDRTLGQKLLDLIKRAINTFNIKVGNSDTARLKEAQRLLENALAGNSMDMSKAADNKNTQAFSLQKDPQIGPYVEVDTDQSIFEGQPENSYPAIARKYILDRFREKSLQLQESAEAKVTKRTAREYAYPKTALAPTEYSAKMRAATELDNLLQTAQYSHSALDDGRHPFASLGWDYYTAKFQVGGRMFEGLLNIAKSPTGNLLYDVTKIKELPHIGISANQPSPNQRGSSSDTNIPPNGTGVNNSISNESEKDAYSLTVAKKDEMDEAAGLQTKTQPEPEERELSKIDTVKVGANKIGKGFYKNVVSGQAELERLSKTQKQNDPAAVTQEDLAQGVRASGGTVQRIAEKNMIDKNGDVIGESFKDLIKAMPVERDDYNYYRQHLHNIDRQAQGKPVLPYTAEESQAFVDNFRSRYPEVLAYDKRFNGWWDKFMKAWVVGDMISEDAYNTMREIYPNYIPTYRKGTEGISGSNAIFGNTIGTQGIKGAKGSEAPVLPLEDTMLAQINKFVRGARKNELYQNLHDTFKAYPKAMANYGTITKGEDNAWARAKADDEMLEDQFDNYEQDSLKEVKKGFYQVTAKVNGEPVTMDVNKDIFDGYMDLSGRGNEKLRLAGDVGRIFTQPIKTGITGINIPFAIANALRDNITAPINSITNNPIKFFTTEIEAITEMVSGGAKWEAFLNLGGSRSGYFNQGKGFADNFDMTENKAKKAGRAVKKVFSFAGEKTEQLPRFTEYLIALKKYGDTPEGRRKAIQASADVTVNFSRNAQITKAADGYVLYLNAAVQGLDKLARQVKNRPISTITKSALLVTVPALLLQFINGDNPNYDDLDDRTKDNYFIIPNLAGDKDENGYPVEFIRIPKTREYGAVLGATAERIFRLAKGEKLDAAFDGYLKTLQEQFMPPNPLMDNFIQPIIEAKSNESWAGTPIVPESMANLSPKYQYDINTTGISKGIGDFANLSPKKLDYVFGQFGGYPWDIVQGMTTGNRNLKEDLYEATVRPFTNRFSADTRYSSKVDDKVYDLLDEYTTKVKDYNHTYGSSNIQTPDKKVKSYLTDVTDEFAAYRKQEKDVLATTLPQKTKETQIDDIRESMLELSRRTVDQVSTYEEDINEAFKSVKRAQYADNKSYAKALKEAYSFVDAEYKGYGEVFDSIGASLVEPETVDKVKDIGIDEGKWLMAYYNLSNATSKKDKAGNTVSGSLKQARIDVVADMDITQKQKYELWEILKEVYNYK